MGFFNREELKKHSPLGKKLRGTATQRMMREMETTTQADAKKAGVSTDEMSAMKRKKKLEGK